jgi:hypothetical protein
MKYLLLTLPLAACALHVDPCRPWPTCNPALEYCRCVEMDRSDRPLVHGDAPDHSGNDHGHHGGSSDDNGDVSDG